MNLTDDPFRIIQAVTACGVIVWDAIEEEIVASFPEIHLLLYGLLLIVIILFEPGGILGGLSKLLRRFRGQR